MSVVPGTFSFGASNLFAVGRKLIIEQQGVEFIIECMREQQKQTELLELACSALYNISLDGTRPCVNTRSHYADEGKRLIDELDALDVIVMSLKNNIDSSMFTIEAISSICRLFVGNGLSIFPTSFLNDRQRHPSLGRGWSCPGCVRRFGRYSLSFFTFFSEKTTCSSSWSQCYVFPLSQSPSKSCENL